MKHSIDLTDLMSRAKESDSTDVRNLAQKIASTLKSGYSKVMPVEKLELGLLIRSLGEGYASKNGDANWSFAVHYNHSHVILTTPIITKK